MFSFAWNCIDLKVTAHCAASEYAGKPLYPKPKGVGFYGLFL